MFRAGQSESVGNVVLAANVTVWSGLTALRNFAWCAFMHGRGRTFLESLAFDSAVLSHTVTDAEGRKNKKEEKGTALEGRQTLAYR